MFTRDRDPQRKAGVFGHRQLHGPPPAGRLPHAVGLHKLGAQQFGQVLVHGRRAQAQVVGDLLLGAPLRRAIQVAVDPVAGQPPPLGGGLVQLLHTNLT